MALYLKYRPQDFSSLVGQTFIKKTLSTAVAQNKTVGAYLFTGPRGTGKTSTARIFAKAINCENLKDGNPCGECRICKAFAENSLIDIIEIDAASYTGVDNIREIIEKAQFQPTTTKYKIYIIDEVHMLSKGAFNALLKILEEPPEHIKFILATTEIQKVPETILSRCQRYDFKNFSDEDILGRLQYIAEKEGIKVDEKSYEYIIKSAEGGMRNAVSLFEQLISNNTISFDVITETLGITSEDEKKDFLSKLLRQDVSALEDFEILKKSGKNLKSFIKSVAQLLQKESIGEIQSGKNISHNIFLLETLQEILFKTKNSFDEGLTLQIGILKILNTNNHSLKNVLQPLSISKVENSSVDSNPQKTNLVEAALNIFASEETPKNIEKGEDIGRNKEIQTGGLDIERLISQMRIQGAKAAATMSLRGSEISQNGENLIIQTKTKVSFETLQKTDNQEYIFQAADIMGLGISRISVS